MIFCIFIKLIWLGVGFLNRTGAEIGYWLYKKMKKIVYYWKTLKNTESAEELKICKELYLIAYLESKQLCDQAMIPQPRFAFLEQLKACLGTHTDKRAHTQTDARCQCLCMD